MSRSQPADTEDAVALGPHHEGSGIEVLLRAATTSRPNVFEDSVERIGQLIKLGLLAPGEQLLPERELAVVMGISRSTLRAAIQALVEAGFITVRRGRTGGTFVADAPPISISERSPKGGSVNERDLTNFLERRFVIETGVVELATRCRTAEHILGLRTQCEAMEAGIADLGAYRRLDAQFHLSVASVTGNADLVRTVADLQVELDQLIARLPRSATALEHSNQQHSRLVDLLEVGDASGARATIAEHADATAHFLRGLLPQA